jgi:MFS transporter, SP family, sugar:H+ symporter
MPGGGVISIGSADPNRIEAPMTLKAYFICAFAAFGGIFFGYDSGYVNGVMGMPYFIHEFANLPYPEAGASADYFIIPSWRQSLIVSILSAGTFIGAVVSGDLADYLGRRTTILMGCGVFSVGVVLQVASSAYSLLIAGRLIAGLGVGFVSAIIILYMSEIAPRKYRGTIVSAYQFCITVGILPASCVVYATQNKRDSSAYRIPIAIQWIWALVLGKHVFLPSGDLVG